MLTDFNVKNHNWLKLLCFTSKSKKKEEAKVYAHISQTYKDKASDKKQQRASDFVYL